LETRLYQALVIQDPGDGPQDGYGVVFPDLSGCVSAGDTVQEACQHAFEALALHINGMIDEKTELPPPAAFDAPLPDWLTGAAGKIAASVLVPVYLPERVARISLTMDRDLLEQINAAATTNGETRSEYIARVVRERIETGDPVHGPRVERQARRQRGGRRATEVSDG
jgi:predicted RNase H-like HicB family nuclease